MTFTAALVGEQSDRWGCVVGGVALPVQLQGQLDRGLLKKRSGEQGTRGRQGFPFLVFRITEDTGEPGNGYGGLKSGGLRA